VPYVRIAYWRWLQLPKFHGTRMSENLFDPFSSTVGGLFWIDTQMLDQTVSAMNQGSELTPETITNTRFRVTGDRE
jgi:microcin C transport system substrate-binding protein